MHGYYNIDGLMITLTLEKAMEKSKKKMDDGKKMHEKHEKHLMEKPKAMKMKKKKDGKKDCGY